MGTNHRNIKSAGEKERERGERGERGGSITVTEGKKKKGKNKMKMGGKNEPSTQRSQNFMSGFANLKSK